MKDIYLANNQYEVLETRNGDCIIKEKESNKYFFKEKYFASEKYKFNIEERLYWNLKDTCFTLLIFLSLIAFAYIFSKYENIYNANYKFTKKMYINSFIYLICSIIVHEMAHYFTMFLYGRRPGKIRLRRYYIFLTIVTNTTDSYMLPWYRRAFVYYAGVMANLIMYALTLLIMPSASYLLRVVIWGIIYNLVPFGGLKTDGYHIFVNSILNVKDLKNKESCAGKITKYIFIIFSIATFIDSVMRVLGLRGLLFFL